MTNKRGINELLISLPEKKKVKIGNETGIEIKEVKNEFKEIQGDLLSDTENEPFNNKKGYVQGPVDPIFGQRSAFPVVINMKNVNLDKIPKDVNEYLAQVRLEACMCNPFNYNKNNSNDDDYYENNNKDYDDDYVFFKINNGKDEKEIETDKKDLIIEKEFIDKYIEEYKSKRKEYNEYRMNLYELDVIELPKIAKDWKKFIWEVSCEREYIAQIIEEEEYIKLIAYFAKWLSLKIDDNYKEWVFAILESIEEILPQTAISVIRQLGKKALKQLLQIQNGGVECENVDTYKKILTIIGIFYKQKDLLQKQT